MIAYLERLSPVHRLDPRVKIAWSVIVSLLAVVLRQPLLLAGLLALALLPWFLVRPPLSRLRFLLAAVGTTVLGTLASQGFFYTLEPRTELLRVLPGLSLSVEGVWYGGVVALRLLAVLAAGTLVVFTTHPADLILALTKLGLPQWFSFMLTLALRFLPETIEQAKRILVAQQLRGAGGRGPLSAARRFRLLVVPLLTSLLRSARQIAMAAEVRAYSARRVPSRELRLSKWDWGVLFVPVATVLRLVVCRSEGFAGGSRMHDRCVAGVATRAGHRESDAVRRSVIRTLKRAGFRRTRAIARTGFRTPLHRRLRFPARARRCLRSFAARSERSRRPAAT